MNWGPWEEQSVFLMDELALQPKFLLNIVSHLTLSSAKLMRTVSSFSEVINAVVPLNGDVRAGHSRECQSLVFFLLDGIVGSWGAGSVSKSVYCPCSLVTHTATCNSCSRGSNPLSWPVWAPCCMWCPDRRAGRHVHKIKMNKFLSKATNDNQNKTFFF